MRNAILLAVLGFALVASPLTARAIVTSRVVLVVAVKLSPDQTKQARAKAAELAKAGVELFEDPSMYSAEGPPVTLTTWAGRTLASQDLRHNSPQAAAAALPTAAELTALKRQLAALGLPDDLKIVALIVYSGGK
jgi:hypothetical protein